MRYFSEFFFLLTWAKGSSEAYRISTTVICFAINSFKLQYLRSQLVDLNQILIRACPWCRIAVISCKSFQNIGCHGSQVPKPFDKYRTFIFCQIMHIKLKLIVDFTKILDKYENWPGLVTFARVMTQFWYVVAIFIGSHRIAIKIYYVVTSVFPFISSHVFKILANN